MLKIFPDLRRLLVVLSAFVVSADVVAAEKPLNPERSSPISFGAGISVSDAVVYLPLGNSQTTQAFFSVRNGTQADVQMNKVTSTQVTRINLVAIPPNPTHPMAAWLVPAGKTLVLKPNKHYLQLTGLKSPLASGDELHLEVSFSNGQRIVVVAKAKSAFDQIHGY